MGTAWRAGSPPLRRAKSDTRAAGERNRDSQRPAPRFGGRNSVVWLSWSSVFQTARSTKPPNGRGERPRRAHASQRSAPLRGSAALRYSPRQRYGKPTALFRQDTSCQYDAYDSQKGHKPKRRLPKRIGDLVGVDQNPAERVPQCFREKIG